MCNPLIIGLIATAAQYQATQQANKTQQAVLAGMTGRDNRLSDKALEVIQRNLAQYNPQARQQALDSQVQKSDATLLDTLGKSHDAGQAMFGKTPGRVSTAFTTNQANRFDDTKKIGDIYARLTSRARAPYDLRTEESLENANFAGEGSAIEAYRRRLWDAGMAGLGRVQPNQYALAAGSAMQGYANSKTRRGR